MNIKIDTSSQVDCDVKAKPSKVPNTLTRKAMKELDEGGGKRYSDIEDLFEDLGL